MTAYPTHETAHTPTLAGDSSLAFLRDPYGFLPRQSRSHDTDVIAMRLMLRPTLCVTGPEAAELFYDRNRFVRQGAAPWWLRMTLFGPQLVLSGALRLLLTRTVGEWAGIPLPRGTTDRRTRELTALYADAVPLGTRHGRAYLARFSLERWLGALIQRARTGALRPPEQSALATIAWHWDPSGELLPPRVAAVELLNVVRPLVAVSIYLTFVAHALRQHPESSGRASAGPAPTHASGTPRRPGVLRDPHGHRSPLMHRGDRVVDGLAAAHRDQRGLRQIRPTQRGREARGRSAGRPHDDGRVLLGHLVRDVAGVHSIDVVPRTALERAHHFKHPGPQGTRQARHESITWRGALARRRTRETGLLIGPTAVPPWRPR